MALPRSCVILAMHNGAAHLTEQLQSYREQTQPPRWVVASDDGSTDGSAEVVRDFFDKWPACTLILCDGPCKGYAANFLHLIAHIPSDADFVALSDQDDVWLPEKIERAVAAMSVQPADRPCLYGAATWVCDDKLQNRTLSRVTKITPQFEHALTQNFAGGNTMILNAAGIGLLKAAATCVQSVPVHDWWIYQIVSGAGGYVTFDEAPCLLYRQHSTNQIGANDGLPAMLRRFREMIRGTYRDWNTANLAALDACADLLTPKARRMVDDVRAARTQGPFSRLRTLRRNRLVRQGIIGQTGLWVSMLLNRF